MQGGFHRIAVFQSAGQISEKSGALPSRAGLRNLGDVRFGKLINRMIGRNPVAPAKNAQVAQKLSREWNTRLREC